MSRLAREGAFDDAEPSRADEPGAFETRPDLIVVDGGKGQLSAALSALEQLGIAGVPVISLAKREEEVFVPGRSDPVVLDRESEALFLLQRIRDEAHRFALAYHRRLRGKRALGSILEEVPGIGPKRERHCWRGSRQ